MSTRKATLFYAVLIAVASLAVGMVIASRLELAPRSEAQMAIVPASNSAPLNGPIDATTFRNIAKAQSPVVVNIQTTSTARTREMTEFFGGGDDLLRRFFGDPQAPRGRPRRDGDGPVTASAGTGFVIDRAGFILTNNHVVEGADTIRISLFGGALGENYTAKIVGRDALTDSALLQLTEMPSAPLQEAKFGDSDQLQPGDWVVAIGNPFELGHTVTVGVVSASTRPVGGMPQRRQNMIQTDAAINPGNSGGPLLNIRGEVVGMNSAIVTNPNQAANIGIGFATPINTIRDLLPQLRTGKVTRGRIGVTVDGRPITKEMASAMGLPSAGGAVLSTIEDDGPASKAGLEPGDVIIEFNGKPVTNSESLVALVVVTKPGTTVPVTVIRDKQRRTINVTVEELDLEAEQGGRFARRGEPSEPTQTGFGMDLEPITPDIARQLELPRGRGGAIISNVERSSAAANAGLAAGDVILEVNRQPMNNVSQVQRALQGVKPGTPVFLLIWRQGPSGGQQVFVTMTKR